MEINKIVFHNLFDALLFPERKKSVQTAKKKVPFMEMFVIGSLGLEVDI